MKITIQYFDGCPNWQTTDHYLSTLIDEGLEATIDHELIDSHERAVKKGFRGSPTVLIDGVDAFADRRGEVGLACRVYHTDSGLAGSPSLDQLRKAVEAARARV